MKNFRRILSLSLVLVFGGISSISSFAAVLEQDAQSSWQKYYAMGDTYSGCAHIWFYEESKNKTAVIQADALIYSYNHQTSFDLPAGYLGAQPRVYNENGSLLCTASMVYNPPDGNGIAAVGRWEFSLSEVVGKSYYAQAYFKLYNGDGYDAHWSSSTPHLTMRESKIYAINENGQTYGIGLINDTFGLSPELIRAVGINGHEGYVYESDLINEEYHMLGTTVSIPVYKVDGETIIDEFLIEVSQIENVKFT